MRILLVDDDPSLRSLLRETFDVADVEIDEADGAAAARERLRARRPDVVVLDVNMPDLDGLTFCRELKSRPRTRDIPVVLLTGDGTTHAEAAEVGAATLMAKPFSPLELLAVCERLAGGLYGVPFRPVVRGAEDEALLLYARDLRHVLELERAQREALQSAYHETVSALAGALESKDSGTGAHSQRVQLYALELAHGIDDRLAGDQAAAYGFLLHDVGKIGIPDSVLQKPGPLDASEQRLMRTHTVLGEQMLGGVAFLRGSGLPIVRSHHERWDGAGYPDRMRGDEIPLGARIFAVADALDAMTSNRPYRRACPWRQAREEILRESGGQFDPGVVEVFVERESQLRAVRREFAAA
jgi:cyclic di-GMP phosphodiesterase